MNILGFSYWGGGADAHDSSAAIVSNGRIVAAAEEERFTRRKHDGAFPRNAIDYCLNAAGLTMRDIDAVAFPDKPYRSGPDSPIAEMDPSFIEDLRRAGRAGARTLLHKRLFEGLNRVGLAFNVGMDPAFESGFETFRGIYGMLPPLKFYGHHQSHAAATFYTSGFQSATVITADNVGGPYSTVVWNADENGLQAVRAEGASNSLGAYYHHCTRYVGLGDYGEGKMMGLAPYGEPSTYAREFASVLDTDTAEWFRYDRRSLESELGLSARGSEPILEGPWRDLAAAAQAALERAIQKIVRYAIETTGKRQVCLAGGVMMNCASNGALLASRLPIDRAWAFPAAGDAGLAVGAALLCAREMGDTPEQVDNAYWGPGYDENAILSVLNGRSDIRFRVPEDQSRELAIALSEGKVIGWFQGRMEFGPRALGARSILADPRSVAVRDRVNRIKSREMWRPLAPAVLEERYSDYFEISQPSPFMLFATTVRESKRDQVPAIVHVDGSARPQTVNRSQNPQYYDLIRSFETITGVPIVLNTSFNSASEPIVCTPANALDTFLGSDLDLLAIGPFVVEKVR